MASVETIRLDQDNQRNSRLQPSRASGPVVAPPSYDDIQAAGSTLPHCVAAAPAPGNNRTGSLRSMNRLTLSRGGTMYGGTLRLRDRIEIRSEMLWGLAVRA